MSTEYGIYGDSNWREDIVKMCKELPAQTEEGREHLPKHIYVYCDLLVEESIKGFFLDRMRGMYDGSALATVLMSKDEIREAYNKHVEDAQSSTKPVTDKRRNGKALTQAAFNYRHRKQLIQIRELYDELLELWDVLCEIIQDTTQGDYWMPNKPTREYVLYQISLLGWCGCLAYENR